MVKILFLAALVAVSLAVVLACAPNQNYIQQYQRLHRGNPCVQCQQIIAQTTCSNNWHNSQFSCTSPIVNYGLVPGELCGQVTIECPAVADVAQSTMIVALLDNSDGRFGPNAEVYAPISALSSGSANLVQSCSVESLWLSQSTDNFKLAQPLTVQCAHNVEGFVLPSVCDRYQLIQPVAPVQVVESGQVVDEDVQVIILGTTLIPMVKERIVQNVIKEIHNVPIQKKRIIKTKHISKPTAFEREYIERIPGTKIVPTFEERRATQMIHGTTLVPIVEEMEVTEMLPELPVRIEEEQPKAVEQSGYETAPVPPKLVEQSGYEVAPPAPSVVEVQEAHGYEVSTSPAPVPEVTSAPY